MILRHSLYRTTSLLGTCRYYSNKKNLDVSINKENGIATVTMQHPVVNSLNLEFMSELSSLFTELETDNIKGMILTSLYDKKVFSAGLDFNELVKPDPKKLRVLWRTLQDVMINLYGTSYPTVAAINGHALAGGCMLTVGCEYRIMLNNFKIGLNETEVGVLVPAWLGLAMQNTISKRITELASTSSQLFNTDEALKIGLIDEIASDKSEAINKAMKFLQRFEKINPIARARTKQYLRGLDLEIMHKIRDEDLEAAVSLLLSPEIQQTIKDKLASLKNKKKN